MVNFSLFSKWFYRGEGNKTLVISNPETRKVLRLQKSNVTSKDLTNSTQDASQKESQSLQQEIEKSVKLCKQIFIPLLSEKYVEPGNIIELPKEFMTKIKDIVTSDNKERPKFRLSKEVNCQSKFGILMPDFCFVSGDGVYANEVEGKTPPPAFCVEIKPKYGTLPVCIGLEYGVYRKVKESICKYCLFQWTKVNKEGKYPQRSDYCPLDLFSSDMKRVWHALSCLLKNPQNNFRIFQDGKMVYSGETMKTPSYGQLDDGHTTDEIPLNTGATKHHSQLSQLEEVFAHSFVGQQSNSLTNHNLYGETDGTTLTATTVFLATLFQLLIHDSSETTIGCHHCDNHHSSNHPVCEASQYNEARYSISIPTLLTSRGLSFGQDGVLRKILYVQKLDIIGTDKAFSIFNTLCPNGRKELVDLHIFKLNQNNLKSSIDEKTNANCENTQTSANCDDNQTIANCDNAKTHANCDENINITNHDSSVASELDSLTKFLIAASANDCSIMISFQETISGTPEDLCCFEDVLTGKIYKYSIAIVDLDQKDSNRISKYYKEYHDIVDNYLCFNQA